MKIISVVVIPLIILFIIIYAFFNKINVYNSFLNGSKDGIKMVYNIFPTMMAMIFAINIFLNSGFLNCFLDPLSNFLNIKLELLPMAFLRPISGNASFSILNNIFIKYGPDSFSGRLGSILQGCTDTTIYVIALYYGSIKVSKIRYTLILGLLADLFGIIMAFILTNIFF